MWEPLQTDPIQSKLFAWHNTIVTQQFKHTRPTASMPFVELWLELDIGVKKTPKRLSFLSLTSSCLLKVVFGLDIPCAPQTDWLQQSNYGRSWLCWLKLRLCISASPDSKLGVLRKDYLLLLKSHLSLQFIHEGYLMLQLSTWYHMHHQRVGQLVVIQTQLLPLVKNWTMPNAVLSAFRRDCVLLL